MLFQDVELWLADSAEEQSVEEAQATEGGDGRALDQRIDGKTDYSLIVQGSAHGGRCSTSWDVALIFRTYSPMDRFIEALRREGIPFAVESERYFFTTPEVTDFVNLLRAAADPDDMLSLVGYLRSPMGGLTDQDILIRRNAGTLRRRRLQ